MKKNFTLLFFLCFLAVQAYGQTTAWEYTFETQTTSPTATSLGSPSFSEVGVLTPQPPSYFTGINATCSGTVTGEWAYSAQDIDISEGYQFSFNGTNFAGMTFTVCLRAASLSSTTFAQVRASADGGTTWPAATAQTVMGAGTGSGLKGFTLNLPAAFNNNAMPILIQVIKSSSSTSAPTTTFRIDNAKLTATTILPVELVRFRATPNNKNVELEWSTASERDNAYMAVERSTDGRDFTEIGQVKGNGTTSEKQNYSFEDTKPARGVNYYRLRQVDVNGSFEYSKSVVARFGNASVASFVATPNVISVSDALVLSFFEDNADQELELEVYDLQGKLLHTKNNVAAGTVVISDMQLTAGQYLIKVKNTGEYTRFFVKD
jgi:hypothetical protein